ncbi:hypothetical protein Q3G72_005179 [Acer saccharum]|nr:hypothetical protein Q3G72_005179 [Acer saccharum]
MTKSSDVEVIVDRMIDYMISINYNQYKTEIASRCVELAEQFAPWMSICEAFALIEQQPNIYGVVHVKYFDEEPLKLDIVLILGLSLFPDGTTPVTCPVSIYDGSTDKQVGVVSLMAKAVTPSLPPRSPIHGRGAC